MQKIIVAVFAIFIAMPVFAAAGDNKIPTSKSYVDTAVGTKQNKIPAAGTNSGTPGTAVVTYTSAGNGAIGERGIYTGSSNYTSGDANKLATAAALNSAVTGIHTMETTKLTCYDTPNCTLWTIDDQQVYGEGDNNQ